MELWDRGIAGSVDASELEQGLGLGFGLTEKARHDSLFLSSLSFSLRTPVGQGYYYY